MTFGRSATVPERRPSGLVVAGLVMLSLLAVVAIAAPLLSPYAPSARVARPFAHPSRAHLLGTDDLGQDLLSNLLYGARATLLIGVAAAAAATAIGVSVGLVAGYRRGWCDAVLMRVVDTALALPLLPLAIVVGVLAGHSLPVQVAVVALVLWAGTARELRAQVLSARELDHVRWARSMGAGTRFVLFRHVLPEVAPVVVPEFVLATRTAILVEASLSFLGLGDPTIPTWGGMLHVAQAGGAFLTNAWPWWVLPPGVGIAVAVLAFALVGYGLEERARPQLQGTKRGHRPAPAQQEQPRQPERPPVVVRGPHAPVLAVEHLSVEYAGGVRALEDVTMAVFPGEVVGVVGESGSGKSTLAMAATALLHAPAQIASGSVLIDGCDVSHLTRAELRQLHGKRVGLVPQQAMDALNPVVRVGNQIAEALRIHQRVSRADTRVRVAELLELVGLDERWARRYPHQLSGGMRQRVVIAMTLANNPVLLVADEPTTGLDSEVALQVLNLLAELRARFGMAMLVVSHDVSAVLRLAQRVVVIRDGRIVEEGSAAHVARHPSHPYVAELLAAVPRLPVVADVETV